MHTLMAPHVVALAWIDIEVRLGAGSDTGLQEAVGMLRHYGGVIEANDDLKTALDHLFYFLQLLQHQVKLLFDLIYKIYIQKALILFCESLWKFEILLNFEKQGILLVLVVEFFFYNDL